MIRSMTAFTRVSSSAREGHWTIEIRCLNHRYFEFSLKIPPFLNSLEGPIRELVQQKVARGKVFVGIAKDAGGQKFDEIALHEPAVKFYLAAAQKMKKHFGLNGHLSVADILHLPGIFNAESALEDAEKSWPRLRKVLAKALDQTVLAKQREGKTLALDVQARLDKIQKAVARIEGEAKDASSRIFKKLSERLETLLGEKEKDDERFYREAAFLAERSDITEEIVRMKSHLGLFKSRLVQDSEVGRELDFLCQEMNREVNTMSSKAQLFEISTAVVFIKGELEKIREQIQNIE